jgi:aminotransferase
MLTISELAKPLRQSGIRAASSRCRELNGINLGQGICDIPIVNPIKQAAIDAVNADHSTYSACEGVFELRQKVANKVQQFNKFSVSPETEVMISHGATGAFVCAAKTLFNPGDEVILFEPFYGYHKNILNLMNVEVRAIPINLQDFSIDVDRLDDIVNSKTKAIIICTPNNPTGKVFTKDELLAIGEFACKHDLAIITDEIYEYITYPGFEHVSIAALSEELKSRTLTISGFSKTINMTGWRLGYVTGPAHIIEKMSLVQDFLYVCPNTPLQHAGITALSMHDQYYSDMQQAFLEKRKIAVNALREFGFEFSSPEGAYYIMADCKNIKQGNSLKIVTALMEQAKVATVPGTAFYLDPILGEQSIRFCYALDTSVLNSAFDSIREKFTNQT